MTPDRPATPRARRRVLVVDAANVVGARPDGWWKDRAGAAERLLGGLARLAADGTLGRAWPPVPGDPAGPDGTGTDPPGTGSPEVVVVLEGRATAADGVPAGPTIVRAAHGGDDAVVGEVRARAGADVLVTTSDRELRRRVEERGARVRGAGWLRDLLDEAGPATAAGDHGD